MALIPQMQAPDFKAQAYLEGKIYEFDSASMKGKYFVLMFYPSDFSFVCPTEIIEHSRAIDEFRKIGCEVCCISTDSEFTHKAFAETPQERGGLAPIRVPLISDRSGEISRSYGVLLKEGYSIRATFIIAPCGKIRAVQMNDSTVGRSVEETLRLVNGFKFCDENGCSCPVNWKKGEKGMPMTTEGVIEYMKEHMKPEGSQAKTA
ncbi:Thioredoxin peroxidase [Monocercomonoides exilis]|uniref:Thioredoxin peroxidase n=1 Tax=Monocercomonoides exilis TaxID=2049356 RepID=UPI00355A1B6C|nr:Thioredoxin peroxidase [Monocercomonoides exilis]|eukprot:MONOS_4637.1-p1 / transcript=MONOS_4637.1 / gene=MONOS_4637 / organism=Monocercomonoides_exilis_PA203 / gene_product=Thioredoxin peroxidase / transcript_product=Thioredoxin peroxidase / location=Mono_scaffold00125:76344-76958(-) / protein_length=205 / sequence_SO=supercontig / SO=protein_coding / is_pseudo=false